ncbi:hypothetical protein KCU83_g360, partial [Aureobasidium melanogenum]
MYSISREPNHNLLVSSVVLIIVGSFLSVRGQCSNSGGRLRLLQHTSLPPWKEFLPLLLFLPLPFLGLLALSLAPPVRLTGVLGLDSALPSDDAGTTSDDRELTMPVMPASLVPRERVHARQHYSAHHALLLLLTTTPLLLTASFLVQSQFTFAEHLLAEACWDARLIAWRQGLWSQVTPVMVTKVRRQRMLGAVYCESRLGILGRTLLGLLNLQSGSPLPRNSLLLSVSSSIRIGVGLGKIVEARSSGSDKTDLEAVEKSRLIVEVLLADSGAVPLEGLHLLHHPYLASSCLQQSLSVGRGSNAEISSLLSYRMVCGRLPPKRDLCGKKRWRVHEDECQG